MEDRRLAVAAGMAAVGAVIGILGSLVFFGLTYEPLLGAAMASQEVREAAIISWIMVILTDLAVASGVLWLVACFGFLTGQPWAWITGVGAAVPSILAGFFPMIPYLKFFGVPPPSLSVFAVNFVFFLLLLMYVKKVPRSTVVVVLLAGVAYVLCFINGVASTHYYLTYRQPLLIAVLPLSFGASVLWAVLIPGFLMERRWAWFAGLAAGVLGLISGAPVALQVSEQLGRVSLFWPAPVVSLALLLVLFTPAVRQMALRRLGSPP